MDLSKTLKTFFLLLLSVVIIKCAPDKTSTKQVNIEEEETYNGEYFYDVEIDNLTVEEHVVENGEFIENMLIKHKFNRADIYDFKASSKEKFNFDNLTAGNSYYIIKDSLNRLQYFVYDIDLSNYIVCKTNAPFTSHLGANKIEIKEKTVFGIIDTNLYADLERLNVHESLGDKLASIYGWTFDFNQLEKGDQFKVLYDEKMVNGKSGGISNIKAAIINHNGEKKYAIHYKTVDANSRYYDQNGNSISGIFLKSPLKYGKITSRYSKNRLHPVQKKQKAHLGTDFAAPLGTPIRSTAAGEVIEIAYKGANGNYIKIKHDDTYTTQYLHIKKFGREIDKGSMLKQGDIIGYVGSTGLSTGPHVCYRFWNNGVQVDPFKEKTRMNADIPRSEYMEFLDAVYDAMEKLKE